MSHVSMEAACCSASLGWACAAIGLHRHVFAQQDLLDNLASFTAGDSDAIDAGGWLEWLHRDSPRVLADTFCASLAAILLDATWANGYWKMRVLVERFVLGAPLAGVELLKTRAAVQTVRVPWAWLDRPIAERVWQDAVSRGVVAKLERAAFDIASEPDDLYVVRVAGTDSSGTLPCSGSCPQTAELRATLCPEWCTISFSEPIQESLLVPADEPHPEQYYCKLCNVACNSKEQWLDHRNGQKHRKRSQLAVNEGGGAMDHLASGTSGRSEDGALHEPNEVLQPGRNLHVITSTLNASALEFVPDVACSPYSDVDLRSGGVSTSKRRTRGNGDRSRACSVSEYSPFRAT